MSTSLLQILNDCLLVLLLLFFMRVIRAVWVQLNPTPIPPAPPPPPVAAPGPPARPAGRATRAARPKRATAAAALYLRVIEPASNQGEVFELGDEVTIGRSPGCGVSLPDSTVSQVHARLFRQSGSLWIEDLGSTNGTWVNQTKVSTPLALKRGDTVSVGSTTLEVTA